jgi:acyl carrier protein
LGVGQTVQSFGHDTPLLGAIPEFDSMAVVAVVTALEERLGIAFDDEEITAEAFETVGSLCALVERKMGSD